MLNVVHHSAAPPKNNIPTERKSPQICRYELSLLSKGMNVACKSFTFKQPHVYTADISTDGRNGSEMISRIDTELIVAQNGGQTY